MADMQDEMQKTGEPTSKKTAGTHFAEGPGKRKMRGAG